MVIGIIKHQFATSHRVHIRTNGFYAFNNRKLVIFRSQRCSEKDFIYENTNDKEFSMKLILSVTVIFVGKGDGNSSSNPGRDCLHSIEQKF